MPHSWHASSQQSSRSSQPASHPQMSSRCSIEARVTLPGPTWQRLTHVLMASGLSSCASASTPAPTAASATSAAQASGAASRRGAIAARSAGDLLRARTVAARGEIVRGARGVARRPDAALAGPSRARAQKRRRQRAPRLSALLPSRPLLAPHRTAPHRTVRRVSPTRRFWSLHRGRPLSAPCHPRSEKSTTHGSSRWWAALRHALGGGAGLFSTPAFAVVHLRAFKCSVPSWCGILAHLCGRV